MMQILQLIAKEFNRARIPLMVLKGAALNLLIYDQPDARPMDDIDLMIRAEDIDRARAVLEEMGGLRGAAQVREDFFPRFHYETEYNFGTIYPVKVDLHVRPFRPLRYAVTIPEDAFWDQAVAVRFGEATVLVPSPEDMVIHLSVHAAVHGEPRPIWLRDIKLWIDSHPCAIDWEQVFAQVTRWGLVLPLRTTLGLVEREYGSLCPSDVSQRLDAFAAPRRERLALWQAPRDADHPAAHIAVNVLCTPSWRLRLSYLGAVLFPDRAHMSDWYGQRHAAWLLCAHLVGWLSAICSRLSRRLL
ncbi:MAG: nucleotidyltransferase family protein, partial [Phycisphaerales bacterium]|nr:nucleotidyltransferase family protein [Phycisphaerales bacterium]